MTTPAKPGLSPTAKILIVATLIVLGPPVLALLIVVVVVIVAALVGAGLAVATRGHVAAEQEKDFRRELLRFDNALREQQIPDPCGSQAEARLAVKPGRVRVYFEDEPAGACLERLGLDPTYGVRWVERSSNGVPSAHAFEDMDGDGVLTHWVVGPSGEIVQRP